MPAPVQNLQLSLGFPIPFPLAFSPNLPTFSSFTKNRLCVSGALHGNFRGSFWSTSHSPVESGTLLIDRDTGGQVSEGTCPGSPGCPFGGLAPQPRHPVPEPYYVLVYLLKVATLRPNYPGKIWGRSWDVVRLPKTCEENQRAPLLPPPPRRAQGKAMDEWRKSLQQPQLPSSTVFNPISLGVSVLGAQMGRDSP